MSKTAGERRVGLAVETSGCVGSVALGRGEEILEAKELSDGRRHAVELLPVVQMLCRRHNVRPGEVAEVYVSGGPGSFTGLRIGITFAKTLALGGGTRVVRVPTLDVIAQNVLALDPPPAYLAVVLDAKRGRVYAAAFELVEAGGPGYRLIMQPAEVAPADFLARMPPGSAVVGEGTAYHREAVEHSGLVILPAPYSQALAEMVYRLGRRQAAAGCFDDPNALTPIYIRRPEAEEVYERRHGEPTT
ncbi:MAG: tRNA (adenosine(37)-N6)-threonylcarbamoyltransferase complex dimerization subunit type 1 TsaB [Planctomycetota bacterium]